MKCFLIFALFIAGCSGNAAPPSGATVLPAGTYIIRQTGNAGNNFVTKAGTRPYFTGNVIVFTDQESGATCAMSGSYMVTAVNVVAPPPIKKPQSIE